MYKDVVVETKDIDWFNKLETYNATDKNMTKKKVELTDKSWAHVNDDHIALLTYDHLTRLYTSRVIPKVQLPQTNNVDDILDDTNGKTSSKKSLLSRKKQSKNDVVEKTSGSILNERDKKDLKNQYGLFTVVGENVYPSFIFRVNETNYYDQENLKIYSVVVEGGKNQIMLSDINAFALELSREYKELTPKVLNSF